MSNSIQGLWSGSVWNAVRVNIIQSNFKCEMWLRIVTLKWTIMENSAVQFNPTKLKKKNISNAFILMYFDPIWVKLSWTIKSTCSPVRYSQIHLCNLFQYNTVYFNKLKYSLVKLILNQKYILFWFCPFEAYSNLIQLLGSVVRGF